MDGKLSSRLTAVLAVLGCVLITLRALPHRSEDISSGLSTLVTPSGLSSGVPINIGSRLEPFFDDFLIQSQTGTRLCLQHPVSRDVAIVFDKPWEGNTSTYVTVFKDGDLFRMYYRGSNYDPATEKYSDQNVCYAESRDGLRFEKPELGLFAYEGSKKNNIVWKGLGSHNFAPFKDANPACPPAESYKAVASDNNSNLYAFKSPDGLHWSLLRPEPIITGSPFDSLNLAFWDTAEGRYLEFHRDLRNKVRDIMTGSSADFVNWTKPRWLDYGDAPVEHLYTNAITPYFRAPHILIGFPKRFMPDRKVGAHKLPGVSDGVFMSSRDGLHWKRWAEAFLRPGLQKERWVNRNNLIAWGIIETESFFQGAPDEISLYSTEGYYVKDCRMRRHTVRLDGFVSVHADAKGGEMVTKPLIFSGRELVINYSTSAAGSVKVEILDEQGKPIPGFSLEDATEIYGDDVEFVVPWKAGASLESLAGRPVRLRFVMKDADLYSVRFR
jgi:hypothetical protein